MFSAIAIHCFLIDRWIKAEAIKITVNYFCVCANDKSYQNYSANNWKKKLIKKRKVIDALFKLP